MLRNIDLSLTGRHSDSQPCRKKIKMLVSVIDYFIGNHQLSYRLNNSMHLFWDETQTENVTFNRTLEY